MSLDSAKQFLEKVISDEEFSKQLLSFSVDKKKKWEFIKQNGFDFSGEELKTTKAEVVKAKKLTMEELEKVAGGHS